MNDQVESGVATTTLPKQDSPKNVWLEYQAEYENAQAIAAADIWANLRIKNRELMKLFFQG